jgi:hypothetical protein
MVFGSRPSDCPLQSGFSARVLVTDGIEFLNGQTGPLFVSNSDDRRFNVLDTTVKLCDPAWCAPVHGAWLVNYAPTRWSGAVPIVEFCLAHALERAGRGLSHRQW